MTRPALPCADARALKVDAIASHSRGDSCAPLMRRRSVPASTSPSAQAGVASTASGAVTMMYTWRSTGGGSNSARAFSCNRASACAQSRGSPASGASPRWPASQAHSRRRVSRTCPLAPAERREPQRRKLEL
jgi:hypothetical protein